ncbi:ATP-binding cassette, regulator of translational elongation [Paecilomyces lecythidis]|uniref:ATP-binding cassette, regulator of translational elongation n=1 Tax=Paecilomyces lecythidis TaxID=3004212 RepID=A0ABR3X999_9EURO
MAPDHLHDGSGAESPLLVHDNDTRRSPRREHEDELEHDDSQQPLVSESTESYGGLFVWILTFSAGISGLLFGYDTGVISSMLVTIGSDLSNRPLTTADKSIITSCTSLFALISSPIAGLLADRLGRRKVILVADGLFAIGALWQALTSSVWGMIAGRSAVGLAVGAASLVTALYISELAPSEMRGRLVTILSLLITGGQVVAYVIGWLFSSMPGGWRWIVGLGALPAFLQLGLLFFLPETPRWLVQAGQETKARAVLGKIYGSDPDMQRLAERVFRDIEREVALEEEEMDVGHDKPSSFLDQATHSMSELFRIDGNRRALTIAVMLQGVQQLCGFNSLMYFSATLFSLLSFSSPTLISLSVAVTNFLFTLFAFSQIDRIGRRRILLLSIPIMTISLIVCTLAFLPLDLKDAPSVHQLRDSGSNDITKGNTSLPIIILLSLIIYTASYAAGLGNVPWQQSELFPLNVRSVGSALATATNWGSNFIVGLTFLPLMEWISPSSTFLIYAAICAAGWVGVWAIYPEMSGLSLEEVKELLADGYGVQESLARRRRA